MTSRPARVLRAALVVGACTFGVSSLAAGPVAASPPVAPPASPPVAASPAPVVFPQLPDPQPTAEESREKADEILAGREFQRPPQNWLEKAGEWLQGNLVRLLTSLFEGGAGAAATWLIVAVIVGGLVYLIRRLVRTVQPDPGLRSISSVEVRRSAESWRSDAASFEEQGQWKDALRCRFRALVGDLVDRGALRDVAGRTAGEYRRELGASVPGAAGSFDAAAELFERAWYGDEPTGQSENAEFRSFADRVLSETNR